MESPGPITDLFALDGGLSPPVVAPSGAVTRGFGGHVAAVALAAAYATIAPGQRVHHSHVEFLRPATAGDILRAEVDDASDSRTFSRRHVTVGHPGAKPALVAATTFVRRDLNGPDYQLAPTVPPPTRADAEVVHDGPVLVRSDLPPSPGGAQRVWVRPRVRPLATEPWLRDCALLFMSDLTVLWPTLSVHGRSIDERHTALATVSHSIWFHRDVDLDAWLLYDQQAESTAYGLGQVTGRFWTEQATLAATVVQVGTLAS